MVLQENNKENSETASIIIMNSDERDKHSKFKNRFLLDHDKV